MLAQSDGEVVDLLAGGQGVFNILPLSGVVSELEAAIVEIRETSPSPGPPTVPPAIRRPTTWPRPKRPSVDRGRPRASTSTRSHR